MHQRHVNDLAIAETLKFWRVVTESDAMPVAEEYARFFPVRLGSEFDHPPCSARCFPRTVPPGPINSASSAHRRGCK